MIVLLIWSAHVRQQAWRKLRRYHIFSEDTEKTTTEFRIVAAPADIASDNIVSTKQKPSVWAKRGVGKWEGRTEWPDYCSA
jgi:hypothetical protein